MTSRLLVLSLAVTVVSAYPSQAHTSNPQVIDRSAIERTLATKVAAEREQRETVLRVLNRAETKSIADRLGIPMTQLMSAVDTMDAQDLASVADQAARADAAYVGGADTIVISTTTLLVALLVLLLLVD